MGKKLKKTQKSYHCEKCDFSSKNKNDFRRHLSTRKHQMDNMDNIVDNKKNSKAYFVCDCGKTYKFRSGLSKHFKKCTLKWNDDSEADSSECPTPSRASVTGDMFNKLVEQNNNLMEKLIAISKERTVINYQNCNNKKMTINVFLNEQCKNAMNLTDFVENVKVSLDDLMYTKRHGYIEGISNIFVKHLQNLDPTERPIHCSDKKRMQFYVKDEDEWKRDRTHEKIDKSIQDITVKQIKSIKEWEKAHPNYLSDEALLTEWHTMIQRIMGGGEDIERDKNKEQIKKSLGSTTELKDHLITIKD